MRKPHCTEQALLKRRDVIKGGAVVLASAFFPFSIEILFQYTTRFNFLAPIGGQSSQRTEINFAKIEKNSEYFYWTEWEGFDPYNEAHLKYNDFILIEAERVKWRIIE